MIKQVLKSYTLPLLVILFCHNVSTNAQDKNLFKKYFNEGDKLFLEKNYNEAINSYLNAFKLDSNNANMRYKLGLAYMHSPNQKDKSIKYLLKASKNTTEHYHEYDASEDKAPLMVHYYLGLAYQLNYQFDQAGLKFQYCVDLFNDKKMPKELKLHIDQCNSGTTLLKNKVDIKIENMGPIFNTIYPDYCPVINADESTLIFTSRRPGGITDDKTPDGQYFEDIYISYKFSDGNWSKPKLISRYINSDESDAAIGLSADGTQLFIFNNENGGDIYYSNYDGNSWSIGLPVGSDINTKHWETHACVSADNQHLYFVSDRPGGYGGRDIYKCVKLPNGSWSLATNLGPTINTEFDEDAPFIHPDGVTLFYSSNGPKSMGGFDIFYSVKTEEAGKKRTNMKWSKPVNLGYPINTTGDDIYYVLSTDGRRAYFSSEREGSIGEKDLFKMTLASSVVDPVTLLVGYLTFDGSTAKIPRGVMITATDDETGEVVQDIKPNVKTGKYLMVLNSGPHGKTYTIKYEADDYLPSTETIKIEPGSAYQELKREVRLNLMNFETKKSGYISVSGVVKNAEGKSLSDVKVIIKDNATGQIVKTYQALNDSGLYYASLESGKNYNMSFEVIGYLFHSENIDIPKQADFSEIKRNVQLEKVTAGSTIVLNNVFFDTGLATLTKESKTELEKVYDILSQNPAIRIEISGHTDNSGSEDVNLRLSQARAQSVVNYLVENERSYYIAPYYYKGIDKKRLVPLGYGSTKPIADNDSAEGMQKNRRVELKIIGTK
ncbi:MAG: PD40 domain-containing protein [Bacteroidetes bacterium]|nr:PD40 domain-containing protein [Bacteroidota bacterium]